MFAIQTDRIDLVDFASPHDPTRRVRGLFPLHRDTGARSTTMVYFELALGMRLGSHVDSAEEVLVVLEGEVEATVGEERGRLEAGGVALVPAMVPHDVRNVGRTPARVCGVFSANTTVAVFDQEIAPEGMPPTRVLGTPPPEAA